MQQRFKYPRTPHFPFSEAVTDDDIRKTSCNNFDGMVGIITEKMDGENTTLYRDGFHARSIDSRNHPSRNWVKRFHAEISQNIPDGFRICGENVFARHSISYDELPSYFMGFSIWDGETCLSWDDTLEWFELLGIVPVKVLYRGEFNEQLIKQLVTTLDTKQVEGIVWRNAGEFLYSQFKENVAKWVRSGHVQTDKHWMHQEVVPNGLQK